MKNKISSTALKDIVSLLSKKYDTSQDLKLRDKSPNKMIELGLKDLPMLMNSSHIISNILSEQEAKEKGFYKKGTNYHSLGVKQFLEAINSLDNPLAIYKWNCKKDMKYGEKDYIVLTNIKDKNNNSIIVPIYVETMGNYNNIKMETNKIKTIYGKKSIKRILEDRVINGEMKKLYDKRKKSVATIVNNATTGTNSISINNIPQNMQSVKQGISSVSYYESNEENDTYIKEYVIGYGY